MTDKKALLDAIECCRMNDMCERCPLRDQICDVFDVEMVRMPEALVDLIEEDISAGMQYGGANA